MNAELRTRDRFVITNQQVAAKLIAVFAEKGVALDAAQISLPVEVMATERTPALEVRSVERLGRLRSIAGEPTTSAVKISCAESRACLPFYAVITWSDGQSSLGSRETSASLPTVLTPAETLIRYGAHITLILQSGKTNIQMSVISMERGASHQQIKVRTADHKQTYMAEVVDANTVKGTF